MDDEFCDLVGTDVVVVHHHTFDFRAHLRRREFEKLGIKHRVEVYKSPSDDANEKRKKWLLPTKD